MKIAAVELTNRTLILVAFDGTQRGWEAALERAGITRSSIYQVDPA